MVRRKKGIQFFRFFPDNEKIQNNLAVFDIIKKEPILSVEKLGREAGISPDIAALYINACVKKDLLKITDMGNEWPFKFNNNYKKSLGIGFTKDSCILSVSDIGGNIVDKEEIKIALLSRVPEEKINREKNIREIAQTIMAGTKFCGTAFYGAGIAKPGWIENKKAKHIDILAGEISRGFNCDVWIGSSYSTAAYGERDFCPALKGKDILYIHLDAGSGIVIRRGMIYEADEAQEASEKSYLRPWEQFSIVSAAKALVNRGVGTSIVTKANSRIDDITLDVVLRAALENDEAAKELVMRSGLALGVRVAYLVNMFNVRAVVLGGGIGKAESDFGKFVKEASGKFLLNNLENKLEIVSGILGREACSVGAALLCRRELFREV